MVQREVVDALAGAFHTFSRCFLADNLRVAHRPNDANNGLPRRIVPIANALAQGVLMGPILAGKIFIDNGHRLAAVAVLIGEDTSTEQANAHRLEIARANAANVAVRPRIARRGYAPFNIERGRTSESTERQRHRGSCGEDSGGARKPLERAAKKRNSFVRRIVLALGQA